MKIHTVFITYNRLDLTRQAIASYLVTRPPGSSYLIVDNASNDGTQQWLTDNSQPSVMLDENRYPGYATNLGWDLAPRDTQLLHRADNDFIFLPEWWTEVLDRFHNDERLGQLGLRTGDEELHNTHNVGGNCVIRRTLFDEGLRYDERPWPQIKTVGYTEDSYMSPTVVRMGWKWGRVRRPCIQPISTDDPADPYYRQTWADRGMAVPE